MNSSFLLSITTFVYGLAAFLYIASWIFKKPLPGRLATWTAIVGVAGNTAGIIVRWVESYSLGIGHAPLSNLYESLVFFAWTIIVVYLVIERKYENRIIGAFTTPLAFLALAYASMSPNISDRIQPLLPALKSNWLIAHVIACFIGYAAFALAFGISWMYLFKQLDTEGISKFLAHFPKPKILDKLISFLMNWIKSLKAHFPKLGILDDINHQLIMFGFLFLTVGVITGAVWANSAWGRYWGWDPKETWSLITWFIYATLLHARMMRGWQGKRIAYLSIIGFIAVIFTYFGVNYLPGLHSYGA